MCEPYYVKFRAKAPQLPLSEDLVLKIMERFDEMDQHFGRIEEHFDSMNQNYWIFIETHATRRVSERWLIEARNPCCGHSQ